MTESDRREAVRAFGYTERQAGFLCLGALHSGYFLRRQFNQFLGRECGALAETFIERVIRKGHAKRLQLCGRASVYHLCARSLYAAIGENGNRNRRDHAPATIKRRIMALDFALDQPARRFLVTDSEKLELFAQFGVETARCCAERHPIFLEQTGIGTVPSFVYVDEGNSTLCGFESFLRPHRRLFSAAGRVPVTYVGACAGKQADAEKVFMRFVREFGPATPLVDPEVLRKHFQQRARYEARDFASFDQRGLDRFRAERDQFAGKFYEGLYDQWKKDGETASLDAGEQVPLSAPLVTFKAHILKHSYDLFGGFTEKGDE